MDRRLTRTHTRWWDDDQLEGVRREADELEADALERMPYVDDEGRQAMMLRLSVLKSAIGLMAEEAG